MKIIDKIAEFQKQQLPFYSFEFFPPKTQEGLHNLYARLERMAALEPAFVDITWGTGGKSGKQTLEMCHNIQKYLGLEVMMHLTCTNMTISQLDKVISQAKDNGIRNILALRGDPPEDGSWEACKDGFRFSSELTKHIKDKYQDHFGIAVGGYPEGHTEAKSKAECIQHLKQKVDAGADFVVTQLFYDIDEFKSYVRNCREAGIHVPILPGIMPIHNYQRFYHFTNFCQIKVPDFVKIELEKVKDDDEKVRHFGVELCVDMCRQLMNEGVLGFHFYTLNLETSVGMVLEKLGLSRESARRRSLPWRASTDPNRKEESVRPIFWNNRPSSYLARTSDWDDFPNGRWGDSRSPTYNALNEYHLIYKKKTATHLKEKRLKEWGTPTTLAEVSTVFLNYCQNQISQLPWCEKPIVGESATITHELARMNRLGMLTINSQPQVNGAPSDHPLYGWGGHGGYVYQKAYVEFFASAEQLDKIITKIGPNSSISYQAINAKKELKTNLPDKSVNAVTWGVFPGKEVKQPTVVDIESFTIWAEEAFQLWLESWRKLYSSKSKSYELITQLHDTCYLINIVENDYVDGNIFKYLT